ncbi:30S ribosomal protein S5 [Labeo rohita]|uniref:30S ribosomal protein S5 n=1 Tax=Labeo rohita TaxID=84645 RepID=A0ABQ8MZP6_LABRO|nr:30S ribosomal protein S5 [Labeo rohita]
MFSQHSKFKLKKKKKKKKKEIHLNNLFKCSINKKFKMVHLLVGKHFNIYTAPLSNGAMLEPLEELLDT